MSQTSKAMANLLAASTADLGDEREVIRALTAAGIAMADIIAYGDEATEHARSMRYLRAADEAGA